MSNVSFADAVEKHQKEKAQQKTASSTTKTEGGFAEAVKKHKAQKNAQVEANKNNPAKEVKLNATPSRTDVIKNDPMYTSGAERRRTNVDNRANINSPKFDPNFKPSNGKFVTTPDIKSGVSTEKPSALELAKVMRNTSVYQNPGTQKINMLSVPKSGMRNYELPSGMKMPGSPVVSKPLSKDDKDIIGYARYKEEYEKATGEGEKRIADDLYTGWRPEGVPNTVRKDRIIALEKLLKSGVKYVETSKKSTGGIYGGLGLERVELTEAERLKYAEELGRLKQEQDKQDRARNIDAYYDYNLRGQGKYNNEVYQYLKSDGKLGKDPDVEVARIDREISKIEQNGASYKQGGDGKNSGDVYAGFTDEAKARLSELKAEKQMWQNAKYSQRDKVYVENQANEVILSDSFKEHSELGKKASVKGVAIPNGKDILSIAWGNPVEGIIENGINGYIRQGLSKFNPNYNTIPLTGIVIPSKAINDLNDFEMAEEHLKCMTQEERDVYAALFYEDLMASKGKKIPGGQQFAFGDGSKSDTYLEKLAPVLMERLAEKQYLEDVEWAKKHEILAGLASIGTNIAAAVGTVAEVIDQGITNAINDEWDKPIDTNAPGFRWHRYDDAALEGITSGMTSVEAWLTQVAISGVDNVANVIMFGEIAPLVMAIEAGTRGIYDASKEGATMGQAVGMGLATAFSEWLGESIDLKFIRKNKSLLEGKLLASHKFTDFVGNNLKLAVNNVPSEALSEATTEVANIVSEFIILKDASRIAEYCDEYVKEHGNTDMSKAYIHTALMLTKDVALSGAAGAISSVGVGAANVVGASTKYLNAKYAKKAKDNARAATLVGGYIDQSGHARDVIDYALEYASRPTEETNVRTNNEVIKALAQDLSKKIDANGNMTTWSEDTTRELGALAIATGHPDAKAYNANQAKAEAEAAEREKVTGVSEEVASTSENVASTSENVASTSENVAESGKESARAETPLEKLQAGKTLTGKEVDALYADSEAKAEAIKFFGSDNKSPTKSEFRSMVKGFIAGERAEGDTDAVENGGQAEKVQGESLDDSSIVLEKDEEKYPYDQQEVIEGYEKAVNEELLSQIQRVKAGDYKDNDTVKFGKASDAEIKAVSDVLKLDITGYDSVVEARQLYHIVLRHGQDGSADESMRNDSDIARMKFVMDNYDQAFYGGTSSAYTTIKPNGRPRQADTVVFAKKINGTYFVVQAVPQTKKKKLFVVSAFISNAALEDIKKQFNNTQRTQNSHDVSLNVNSKTPAVTSEAIRPESKDASRVQNQSKDSSSLAGMSSSDTVSIPQSAQNVNSKKEEVLSGEREDDAVSIKKSAKNKVMRMSGEDADVDVVSEAFEVYYVAGQNGTDVSELPDFDGFSAKQGAIAYDAGRQSAGQSNTTSEGATVIGVENAPQEKEKPAKPIYSEVRKANSSEAITQGVPASETEDADADEEFDSFMEKRARSDERYSRIVPTEAESEFTSVPDGEVSDVTLAELLGDEFAEVTESLAKALGTDVAVVREIASNTKAVGSHAPGQVSIAEDAGERAIAGITDIAKEQLAFGVIIHEFTHEIKSKSQNAWELLEDIAVKQAISENPNAIEDKREDLKRKGVNASNARVREEITTKAIERMVREGSLPIEELKRHLSESERNAFTRFLARIAERARRVLDALGIAERSEFEVLYDNWLLALDEARENTKVSEVASEQKNNKENVNNLKNRSDEHEYAFAHGTVDSIPVSSAISYNAIRGGGKGIPGELFTAAKSGDREAARELVRKVISVAGGEEYFAAIEERIGKIGEGVVFVPLVSDTSTNVLPEVFAQALSEHFGGEVYTGLKKVSMGEQKAKDATARQLSETRFTPGGEYLSGKKVILVDDVYKSGSTAEGFDTHVENSGGSVQGVVALSEANFSSGELNRITQKQIEAIERKIGRTNVQRVLKRLGIAERLEEISTEKANRILSNASLFDPQRELGGKDLNQLSYLLRDAEEGEVGLEFDSSEFDFEGYNGNDRAFPKSSKPYTESQYEDYGWAVNEFIKQGNAYDVLFENFEESLASNPDTEAIRVVATGHAPGINNVLVFMSGDMARPKIHAIVSLGTRDTGMIARATDTISKSGIPELEGIAKTKKGWNMRYALPGDVKSFEEYRNGETDTSQTSMFEGVAYDFPDGGVDNENELVYNSSTLDSVSYEKRYSELSSKEHEYYNAAKKGDTTAAFKIINSLIGSGNANGVSFSELYEDVLLLPIVGADGTSKNVLPSLIAEYLSDKHKLRVFDGIYKSTESNSRAQGIWNRMKENYPSFEMGKDLNVSVIRGKKFVLIDDNSTTGRTFVGLKNFIEDNGGSVEGYYALTVGQDASEKMTVSEETWKEVLKIGHDKLVRFAEEEGVKREISRQGLTERECRELITRWGNSSPNNSGRGAAVNRRIEQGSQGIPTVSEENGEVGTLQEGSEGLNGDVSYSFPDITGIRYGRALEQSGALPLGEGATEDNTRVPKKAGGENVGRFARTAIEAAENRFDRSLIEKHEKESGKKLDEEFKKSIINGEWKSVPVHLMSMVADKRKEVPKGKGLVTKADSYIDDFRHMDFTGSLDNYEKIAEGHALVQALMESGKFTEGMKVLTVLNSMYSHAGRVLQSARMLKYAPNEVKAFEFQTMVDEYNRKLRKGASKKQRLLMDEYEQNIKEQQEAQKYLDDTVNDIDEADRLIGKYEKQLDEAKNKLKELESKIAEAEKELSDNKSERGKLEARLKELKADTSKEKAKIKRIEGKIDILTGEKEKSGKQRAAVTKKLDALTAKDKELRKALNKTPVVYTDKDMAKLLKAETPEETEAAIRELMRDFFDRRDVPWSEKWDAWRYTSMLSSVATHVRNISSNAAMRGVIEGKSGIKGLLESIYSSLRDIHIRSEQKSGGELAPVMAAYERTTATALDVARLRRIKGEDGKSAYEYIKEFASDDWNGGTRDALKRMDKNGVIKAYKEYYRVFDNDLFEGARRLVSGTLDFEDDLFLGSAYKSLFTSYIAANYKGGNWESDTNLIDRAREYATGEGLKSVFRDSNKVATWLRSGSKASAVTGVLVGTYTPFAGTQLNIWRRIIEYNPLAFTASIYKLVRGLPSDKQIAVMDDPVKQKQAQIERNQAIADALDGVARSVMGATMAAFGYALASGFGGLLDIGLTFKFDDEEKEQRELMGEQEFSLRIGDHYYSYIWASPAAANLALGAALYEAVNKSKDEDGGYDFSKLLGGVAAAYVEPFFELSMFGDLMENFRESFGVNSYAQDEGALKGATRFVVNTLASLVAQAIPTFGSKATKALFGDTNVRRYQDDNKSFAASLIEPFVETVINKIGGVSSVTRDNEALNKWGYATYPYIDEWGRKKESNSVFGKENGDGGLWAIWDNMLSPGYASERNETAVDGELWRIYKSLGDNAVFPKVAGKTIDGKRLSARQYTDYAVARGEAAYNILDKALNDSDYLKLSDKDKAEFVRQTYLLADKLGRGSIFADYESDDKVWSVAKGMDEGDMVDVIAYTVAKSHAQGLLPEGDVLDNKGKYGIIKGLDATDAVKAEIWKSDGNLAPKDTWLKVYNDVAVPGKELDTIDLIMAMRDGDIESGKKYDAIIESGLSVDARVAIWRQSELGTESREEAYNLVVDGAKLTDGMSMLKLFRDYPGKGYDLNAKLKESGGVISDMFGEKVSLSLTDAEVLNYNGRYRKSAIDAFKELKNSPAWTKARGNDERAFLIQKVFGDVKDSVEFGLAEELINGGKTLIVKTSRGKAERLSPAMSRAYFKGLVADEGYAPSTSLTYTGPKESVKFGGVVYSNLRKGEFDTKVYADYYVEFYARTFLESMSKYKNGNAPSAKVMQGWRKQAKVKALRATDYVYSSKYDGIKFTSAVADRFE